ncbi:uncharacterized protein LOC125234086 [Leguminivora glycinivorella]|uniref:uncharacterized protein LOC125234086 n=1 Tax=Leguminivora glycinivorella TaxID=1035111 RepID=UPI00200C1A72|nr:uncharacterized protein LOC125234086 [Leguminivora glycinivorella]XP_047996230.1 uncharacterized protein LOC125234086 [Leguminivora glycinivorella]XP_047996231.1 uncharacterized protein LOC125234086 [Leguminivora glycinivorella]
MYSEKVYFIFFVLFAACWTSSIACLGSRDRNKTNILLQYFPCQWLDGIIPFVFDFYAINSNRLLKIIRQGHELIQNQSCLVFNERNPIAMAQSRNSFHYLYYTYSNALEDCCYAPIDVRFGRRVVLISPGCKEPHEIAHVTLHMLGLRHGDSSPFPAAEVNAVLYPGHCQVQGARAKGGPPYSGSE